ncbi:359_t:CDS:1, partial [Entrophospora sp. SA101]
NYVNEESNANFESETGNVIDIVDDDANNKKYIKKKVKEIKSLGLL